MCLGVPGLIVERWQADGAIFAHADFLGETRKICLNYVPELGPGDYVITHAGFALTLVSAEEADRTIAMMREHGLLDPEQTTADVGGGP